MSNKQLFRNEQEDISNYNIWQACNEYTLGELRKFYEDAYATKGLGEILYDGEYIELAKAIKRDVFISGYAAIIKNFKSPGSYESLITIIKAIFGNDAEVEFTNPAAGVLGINIGQHSSEVLNWVTKDGKNLVTIDGNNLIFQVFINQIYIDEVINLFNQFVKPAGMVYIINITHI